jgi:diguanylate cyclase (GGDEF)-like protein/PAS domain S-box-containing protein
MNGLFSPRIRISLGLTSLTLSLILIASAFGLWPDKEQAELQSRATLSGALAIQLAVLASRNDAAAIQDTIDTVVSRGPDVLSIGIRGVGGELMAASRDHAAHWQDRPGGNSTPTHVQVPLSNGDQPAGRIEIVFRSFADAGRWFGSSSTLLMFVGFIGGAGFAGYNLLLSRALRELDPGRAIPERVKAAFDTLAEGVLIIDDEGRVLLANQAFSEKILGNAAPELGSEADDLPWLSPISSPLAPNLLPWRMALEDGGPVLDTAMAIRNRDGELHRLIVNAAPIVDGEGATRGVIATFNDVTAVHRANEQLSESIHELALSRIEISKRNQELQFLASSDPLTGCLNRRTFFEQAEGLLADAVAAKRPLSFVMIDADHFKTVNDRFGHLVGDNVLVGLANLLRELCAAPHLVGRYGGEEFCLAITGLSEAAVARFVEQIRLAVSDVRTWLPSGERTTVSIGIAFLGNRPCTLADLVRRADAALYAAKSSGRNRVVNWKDVAPRQSDEPVFVAR